MTKAELIAAIAEKAGLSKTQTESTFNATFSVIAKLMAEQQDVAIPGFGKFVTKIREERKGRNPSNGQEMLIPKATVAGFKPASQLKELINE